METIPTPPAQPQVRRAIPIRFQGRDYSTGDAFKLAIREYQLGNFETAADLCRQIVTQSPGSAAAHNNLGNMLQKMQRLDEALASYDRAIALNPDYGEAHSNRGVTLQVMRKYAEALASYDRAIGLKPDCAEAYNNRAVTLRELQRHAEALASHDRSLALNRSNPTARNNRAVTLLEMERHAEALADYDEAVAMKPDYAEAYANRGIVLYHLKRYEESLASHDRAISLKPDLAEAHNNRGNTLQKLKLYDEALASYDRALVLKPDYADACVNRGVLLVAKGDMQNAEKMFCQALALRPDFAAAWFNLTRIRKPPSAESSDADAIRRLLDNPGISPKEQDYLYYSLGKIYDDCALYEEAFASYRTANRLRNASVAYDPDGTARLARQIREVFSREFLSQPFPVASENSSPIFIVGLPRSGTTLLASMLSNHPSVATAGELPTIPDYASQLKQLTGGDLEYPAAVRKVTPALAGRLATDYLLRLRRDFGPEIPRVIDKQPFNFWHLGLIALLFPRARIIHCTRNLLDVGLSNYFQRFDAASDYSFDLRNIGHFFGEYARLMAHWRAALPRSLIEVSYEQLVLSSEQTVRGLLAALDLEWDSRCLAPHTNKCPVETASQWQVRQPVYRQSLERWRNYEKHLGPLKEALLPAGAFIQPDVPAPAR